MTSLDTESVVDRPEGLSVRDAVEAAYASHSQSPDLTSIVSGAVEHDRATRHRDRAKPVDHYQHAGDSSTQLRSTIRGAIHETKLKATSGPAQPAKHHEVAPGAPASWDLNAKAQWHDLPQEARLAVQREQAEAMNAIESKAAPALRQYAEIDQVLAPHREIYRQHGLKSDAEYVSRLTDWHRAVSDPSTKVQSIAELMVQNGITVHDLFALAGAPQQYQQYAQHYGGDPIAAQQEAQAVHQELARFSQGRPHFEQVRVKMGELIRDDLHRYTSRDGNIDLSKAYIDACRHNGLGGDNRARRAANVSPRSRSPAMSSDAPRRGSTIRNAIIDAFREGRAE